MKILQLTMLIIGFSSYSFAEYKADLYGNNTNAGQFAEVNGIKLYYEIYGSGDPMVLIHGNRQNIAALKEQIRHFATDYKVIVADSRGHGQSGLETNHLTYVQMMEDWNSLLEHLQISNTNIFGWSDGGILGLLLAIHHPEKVKKMAIMGANLRPDETAVYSWTKPILQQDLSNTIEMIAKKDSSKDWNKRKQLLNLLMTQPNIETKSLHSIQAPVLVVAGDRDVIKEEHTLEIFQNINNSHLAILPGNTHFAPVTHPQLFNTMLSTFFDKPFTKPTTKAFIEGNH